HRERERVARRIDGSEPREQLTRVDETSRLDEQGAREDDLPEVAGADPRNRLGDGGLVPLPRWVGEDRGLRERGGRRLRRRPPRGVRASAPAIPPRLPLHVTTGCGGRDHERRRSLFVPRDGPERERR